MCRVCLRAVAGSSGCARPVAGVEARRRVCQAIEAERGHGEALEHLRVEVVQHCHTAAKLQREQRRQARAAARLEHGRAARAEGSVAVARAQLVQEVDRALPELEAALVSSWHEIRGAHGRREAGRVCEQFRNPRLGHDRLSKLGEAAHRAPFGGSTSRRGVACCRMAGGAGARPHRLYWPAARVNLLVERHLSRLHQLGCGRAGGQLLVGGEVEQHASLIWRGSRTCSS